MATIDGQFTGRTTSGRGYGGRNPHSSPITSLLIERGRNTDSRGRAVPRQNRPTGVFDRPVFPLSRVVGDVLVILCGPPASGKTTLARGLRERLASRGRGVSVLHSDDFRRRTYEQMAARVREAGGHWILDGTFYRRDHRERFWRLDDCFVVWVRASLETCLDRNREREEPVSERGVHVMFAEFEPPRADLTLETDELSAETALDRLEAAVRSWIRNVGTDATGG